MRLTPRGGRDCVEGWATGAEGVGYLKARVAGAPQAGKANAALIALLARILHVPKSAVAIGSGEMSRMKRIVISGDADALTVKLKALGDAT